MSVRTPQHPSYFLETLLLVTICHWENTRRGIINRLAENTGKLAIYFTKDRCKHNGDIVLKLREEQEISQCPPEVSLLTTPVEKKLASEKTNYRE